MQTVQQQNARFYLDQQNVVEKTSSDRALVEGWARYSQP